MKPDVLPRIAGSAALGPYAFTSAIRNPDRSPLSSSHSSSELSACGGRTLELATAATISLYSSVEAGFESKRCRSVWPEAWPSKTSSGRSLSSDSPSSTSTAIGVSAAKHSGHTTGE